MTYEQLKKDIAALEYIQVICKRCHENLIGMRFYRLDDVHHYNIASNIPQTIEVDKVLGILCNKCNEALDELRGIAEMVEVENKCSFKKRNK